MNPITIIQPILIGLSESVIVPDAVSGAPAANVLLDEIGGSILDETGAAILDET